MFPFHFREGLHAFFSLVFFCVCCCSGLFFQEERVFAKPLLFRFFLRKMKNVFPCLKPAGGAISASYTAEFVLRRVKESPSCTYFSAGQKTPVFSCRTFSRISPLSLQLYLAVAERYFCRKQAIYFAATNLSKASARA